MKYFSEILNKNFDTEKELVKAEEEHKAEQAKKAEAKALIKKESEDVEKAFKIRNEARRAYNEKLIELRKAYNKEILEAKESFEKGLEEIAKDRDAAEVDYDTKLREFQKAHQNYHITLKDGDNVVTLTSNNKISFPDINKEFDDILDLFSNILKRL